MGTSPASTSSPLFSSSTSTFAFPIFAPNISHVLPVKLDRNNFLLWRSQFLPILRLHNAMGYVDGSYPCPSQFSLDNKGSPTDVVNPDFLKWQTQDQTLLSWFLSSLTEPILAQVVGLSTAKDVWQTLERIYSAQSRAKIMSLKYQLHSLKKGSLSMSDYVQKKKSITDNLAAVAQPVSDSDLASSLLSGLSSEYEAFITAMTTRFEPVSLDELTGFLLSQEARLEEREILVMSQVLSLERYLG